MSYALIYATQDYLMKFHFQWYNMEPRYVIIMDFSTGELIKIKLTELELKVSEEYEDFSDFLSTLEDKYNFRLKDGLYMTVETLYERTYNM